MPPAGRPRPDAPGYNSLIAHLETDLDRAAAAKPNPGRPAIHRLNRAEYTNAIRDLLAIDIDAESLASPTMSDHGFDNIGDALSVSPVSAGKIHVSGGAQDQPAWPLEIPQSAHFPRNMSSPSSSRKTTA